jgi:hypothetical protein
LGHKIFTGTLFPVRLTCPLTRILRIFLCLFGLGALGVGADILIEQILPAWPEDAYQLNSVINFILPRHDATQTATRVGYNCDLIFKSATSEVEAQIFIPIPIDT